jgi:uncharacterized protein (DUF2235 family)
MIAICGLPTQNFDSNLVDTAFQAYRNKDQRTTLLGTLNKYGMFDAKITMVGVWDTVGSLGIPSLVGKVDPILYGFLDTSLHPDVQNAFHALAIDERRCEFPPTLWSSAPAAGQVLEQVWFSGVHCDVGGGYPECGLSDITFAWMMGKAKSLDLQFADAVWAQYQSLGAKNALDALHDSWSVFWGFPKPRLVATSAALANSVGIRCQYDGTYRPNNLSYSGSALVGAYQPVPVVAPPPS